MKVEKLKRGITANIGAEAVAREMKTCRYLKGKSFFGHGESCGLDLILLVRRIYDNAVRAVWGDDGKSFGKRVSFDVGW